MRALLLSGLLALATPSLAETEPRVVTDIRPVQGLVEQVMGDVAQPGLLIAKGANVHSAQLRPSQARDLQNAQLVIWIGAPLTPWLENQIATLGADAQVLTLIEAPGTRILAARDLQSFGAGDGDHDDHHDHDHDHDHGSWADPHAWLDPDNASNWLPVIAEALAAQDPTNAETYRANAAAGQAQIADRVAEFEASLTGAGKPSFLVFHDAFHYFEQRFGLTAIGALTLSDDVAPSAGHLSELKAQLADQQPDCVFSEPDRQTSLVGSVFEGTIPPIVELDVQGLDVAETGFHYAAMMDQLTTAVLSCQGSGS